MPRVEDLPLPLIDEVRAKAAKHDQSRPVLSSEEIEGITAEGNVGFVGSGDYSFVLENGDKTVVSCTFRDASITDLKELFYLQRIYHTLWPHNFPKIHAAFVLPDHANVGVVVKDKITGQKPDQHPLMFSLYERAPVEHATSQHPFSEVFLTAKRMGIPLVIDPSMDNFIAGVDGGEYYVDTPIRPAVRFPLDSILSYVDQENEKNDVPKYTPMQRMILQTSIQRLQE